VRVSASDAPAACENRGQLVSPSTLRLDEQTDAFARLSMQEDGQAYLRGRDKNQGGDSGN
jgi:hypothetical protein